MSHLLPFSKIAVLRWLCPAALLLAGAATNLQASCGDYVQIGNPRMPHQAHTSANFRDDSPRETSHLAASSAPQKPPCNGPACRGNQPSPTQPVPGTPQVRPIEELAIAQHPEAIAPEKSSLVFIDLESRIVRRRERIERPPQPAA